MSTEQQLNPFLRSEREAEENVVFEEQLNGREKAALAIARRMLGTSFDLRKSNGFLQWKKRKQQTEDKKEM